MKYCLVYLIILILFFIACDDVDSVLKYQSCCGSEPVEFVQDSYHIYVPNCFTPNGDNINDLFLPYLSSNIESIKTYEIYSDEDLMKRIFFSFNFSVIELSSNIWYGWDLNNNRYVGKFNYKFVFITNDGLEIAVEGSACAIQCREAAAIFYERKGCFFGTQFDIGGFKDFIPAGEDDCFNH